MAVMLEDEFEKVTATNMEKMFDAVESVAYSHPEGWKVVAGEAVKDINARLQMQYGLGNLNDGAIGQVIQVVKERVRRNVRPAWTEDWSDFIVNRVIMNPSYYTVKNDTEVDAVASEEDVLDQPIPGTDSVDEEVTDATWEEI